MAAMTGGLIKCPLCDADLTLPVTATVETDAVMAVVIIDQGTGWAHIRDEHPPEWERMCKARRQMNASPFIGGMPRKTNGTFLLDGEDVSDIG